MQDITSDEIINDRNTKTSQYPPLSGPIRRILPSFFNFSKFHLTPSVVSSTSAASSFLVDLGLFTSICKIFWVVSIVFSGNNTKQKGWSRRNPDEKQSKFRKYNGFNMVGAQGFEPWTHWLRVSCSSQLSYAPITINRLHYNPIIFFCNIFFAP